MIQQALNSNLDQGEDSVDTNKPSKKKAVKKKTVKKKSKPDGITRFFNNYAANPHLQQIENGYLRHLEVQYAKESHLKELKKFQIVFALKKIQRFWKKKHLEIKNKCASKI